MIKCQNLTIRYGETMAVDQLNMEIEQGEKVSVVGASGCGKTSLLHGMAGILKASQGSITVHNKAVTDIRKETAIILQQGGLFPWKTVYDNISIALPTDRPSSKSIDDLLAELQIQELGKKFPNTLSGGQRQRVAIARALIQSPDLLLMDEPTGALDMMSKERFQDLMLEIFEYHPMTSVTVTHDIEEAVILGQRVIVMEEGSIKGQVSNPDWGQSGQRESLDFYQLCLEVRQVMTS